MWSFKTLKIQRIFQNWFKILKLQKKITTHKWGIMYTYDVLKKILLYKKTLKKLKINFWLWFDFFIIFKDETLNL